MALSSVVQAELYYGAYKNQQAAQTLARLDRFIRMFHSYAFDDAAAGAMDVFAQTSPHKVRRLAQTT